MHMCVTFYRIGVKNTFITRRIIDIISELMDLEVDDEGFLAINLVDILSQNFDESFFSNINVTIDALDISE